MKKMLVISWSEIKNDPRVYRQIQLFREQYHVTAVGLGDRPMSDIEWIPVNAPARSLLDRLKYVVQLGLRQFENGYWDRALYQVALRLLEGRQFDLILANDLESLPLSLRIANNAPVWLDAHEYSPTENADHILWRLAVQPYKDYLCRTYLHQTASMMTVCDGLAEEYARVYGVRSKVVMSAPNFHSLTPSRIEEGKIRLIHHGAAQPGRHLELMIEMMGFLDQRFTLDLMLLPNNSNYLARNYIESLKKLAGSNPRIRILAPVPMLEISKTINAYDMGVFLLKPNNFNHAHTLPNKFFEFVQARLGVAIGPSPEMARLVERHKLGVIAQEFTPQALADRLNALTTSDIASFKKAANIAANELCFEKNAEVLLTEAQRLLA